MPPISKMIPSNYLKTGDIQADGEDGELDLTIADVRQEELRVDSGETKSKWVCYFEEVERGLVLNKTNIEKLAKLCGSELSEDWPGKRVRLYVTPVQFRGEEVDAIRIKAARSLRNQLPLASTATADASPEIPF